MTDGSNPAAQSTTPTAASQASASQPAAVASQVNGNAAASAGASSPASTTGTTQTNDSDVLDMAKIFGEDFTKDPALSKFKSPVDVVKSYKELQSQIGKPRFDVPGQDTPPEQAAEFYKKWGVPETPDAYGLKPDANVPEHNNETNIAFLKTFVDKAHELKLNTSQAQGMQKFFDDLAVNVGKSEAERQAQETTQLNEMLSKALPGEDLTAAANRVKGEIEKVLSPEMRGLLLNKISNEALTAIAVLEKHFRKTYGQSDTSVGDQGSPSGQSVADLQKAAKELYAQILKDGLTAPSYKANMDRYNAMYKTIGELTNAQNRK